MSEYQYYEFRAIDQPLTDEQVDELGQYSSRAEINSTSFINEYNYANFRGSVEAFLDKYFDACVYVANWGTRRLALRVPEGTIDLEEARAYCPGDPVSVRVSGPNLVFDWVSQDEGGEWEEGSGWMQRLAPLREELLNGDRRVLYLAWLVMIRSDDYTYQHEDDPDDPTPEPPVPPGLKKLTAAQKAFVEFMRIDDDLLEVAAEASASLSPALGAAAAAKNVKPAKGAKTAKGAKEAKGTKGSSRSSSGAAKAAGPKDAAQWVASLPQAEKDVVLTALCDGSDPAAGLKLRRRFQRESAGQSLQASAAAPRRTVGELLRAADERGE